MKKTLLLATLLLHGSVAHGAIGINIRLNRAFYLNSPTASDYLGGRINVRMIDGELALSPCFHPSPFIIPPSLGCPLGTTAFIQAGDVDGDGIVDDRSYWSVASVVKSSIIQPYFPVGVTLAAAPPSKLVRPQGDFADNSIGVFYNVLGGSINLYDLTSYRYGRTFDPYGLMPADSNSADMAKWNQNKATYDKALLAAEYKSFADQWVPGVYIYSIPVRDRIGVFTALRTTLTPMVEANGYRKGMRGFGLNTSTWANGAHELDPRFVTSLQWTGNTPSNTVSSDVVRFSMLDPEGNIVYPIPGTAYQLDSPYLTKLNILPYVFTKGDTGSGSMSFSRNLATSGVATDTSTRSWNWDVRFIDSYKGHDLYEFRVTSDAPIAGIKVPGQPAKLRSPNSDYDGDGLSNIMEFAFSQDDGDDLSASLEWTSYHNNPASQPTALDLTTLGFTAPTTAPPVYVDTLADGVPTTPLTVFKREHVGSAITYGYEVCYNTAASKPKWSKLKGPKPGQTVVLKDKSAAKLVNDPNFTWTITDTLDNAPAVGTTSIQASHALPSTVRVRSIAAVTKGY